MRRKMRGIIVKEIRAERDQNEKVEKIENFRKRAKRNRGEKNKEI